MEDLLVAVDEQIEALNRQIDDLKAKVHSLESVRRTLRGIESSSVNSPARARRVQRPGSLKSMAYTVLYEAGKPLTALEILATVQQRFGQSIERTSMSPQLSRLGQDGVLLHHDGRWRINSERQPETDDAYLIREALID